RIVAESVEVLDGNYPAMVEAALAALASVEVYPNPTLAAIAARWQTPPEWRAVGAVPFSSARKWSGADFGTDGSWVLGAPEILLAAATAALPAPEDIGHNQGPPAGLRPVALVRLVDQIRSDAAETHEYFGQ